MDDPYEVLGVSRKASASEVKRAYRKRARQSHPDKGGSTDEMASLNWAWAVLGDESARARFDRGEGVRGPELAPDQEAIGLLCQAFQVGMEKLDVEQDLVGWVRTAVAGQLAGIASQRGTAQKELSKCERRAKKLGYKQSESGHDFFRVLLEQRMEAARKAIAECERMSGVCERAMKLLSDYSYAVDRGEHGMLGGPWVMTGTAGRSWG